MTREEQIYKKAEGDCIAMLESIERGDIIKGSICPQSYRAGFMDGAKWADQYPQWIPVEKRLPHENEEVLAYNAENEEVIACDYHHKMFHCWPEAFNESITHWMPLPQVPRKEK